MKGNYEEGKLGRTAAESLLAAANLMGNEAEVDAFMDTIMRSHRTLQQGAGRFIQALIFNTAEDKWGHDLRNEAWVEFCKAAKPLVWDHPLPFM